MNVRFDYLDHNVLPVARLRALLDELDDDDFLMPNAVGNLLIISKSGEKSLGFIDFCTVGEVCLHEEDDK